MQLIAFTACELNRKKVFINMRNLVMGGNICHIVGFINSGALKRPYLDGIWTAAQKYH
jgi:hypothetical protein